MNAYDVLFDHHEVLRGLCKRISALPPESDARSDALDELVGRANAAAQIGTARLHTRETSRQGARCPVARNVSGSTVSRNQRFRLQFGWAGFVGQAHTLRYVSVPNPPPSNTP